MSLARLEQFCREELERRQESGVDDYIRAAKVAVQELEQVRQSEQRLRDLVRYARCHLHEQELISDREYGDLCADNGPKRVARLESYDDLRAQLERLQTIAAKVIDEALSGGELTNPDLQELAAKAGLLELRQIEAPCSDACACSSMGLSGPVECYRLTAHGREVQGVA